MINLSLNELKLIAKSRDIKDYENKSEDELITILNQPKLKISLSKQKIKEIWEKFGKLRDRSSKSKTKEIRKNVYEMENKNNLSASKIKEIEKKSSWIRKESF